jgi:hypothetical protein
MSQSPDNFGQPSPVTAEKTSTLAIISLVTGIVSWLFLPILGGIAAIVTGHLARREINQNPGQLTGNGLATAGLVLGYLNVVLLVIPCCIIVILALLGPAIGNVFSEIQMGI